MTIKHHLGSLSWIALGDKMRCPNYESCAQRPPMVPAGMGWLLRCPVCRTLYDPESAMVVAEKFAIEHNPGHYDNIVDEEEAESPYTGSW